MAILRDQAVRRRTRPTADLAATLDRGDGVGIGDGDANYAHQDPDTYVTVPRLILNIGSKTLHWTSDFEPGPGSGTCLGCNWHFRRQQVHLLHSEGEINPEYHRCDWAFKKYTFPAAWSRIHGVAKYFESDQSEDDSSDNPSSSGSDNASDSSGDEETAKSTEASSSGGPSVPAAQG